MIYADTTNTGGPTHFIFVLGEIGVDAAEHKVIMGAHCSHINGGGAKVSGIMRFVWDTMNMSCTTMISSKAKC